MSIVKLPKMSEDEITKALSEEHICRIGFIDKEFPYICPFQYVYLSGILYFHFTDYGKKIEILSHNRNVCVSIEKFEKDLSKYYFVSIQGELIEVNDLNTRKEVIKQMVTNAKTNYSSSFLSVHGFDKFKGWGVFSDDKRLRIYKLDNISYQIGLKSI